MTFIYGVFIVLWSMVRSGHWGCCPWGVLEPHKLLLLELRRISSFVFFLHWLSSLFPKNLCQAGGWGFEGQSGTLYTQTECSGKADLEGHLLVCFLYYYYFFQGRRGWKLSACPGFHSQHGKGKKRAREREAWIDGQEVGRWRWWRGLGGRVGRTFTVQLASLCEAEPWAATKCEQMRSREMRTGETRDSILLPCSCLLFLIEFVSISSLTPIPAPLLLEHALHACFVFKKKKRT